MLYKKKFCNKNFNNFRIKQINVEYLFFFFFNFKKFVFLVFTLNSASVFLIPKYIKCKNIFMILNEICFQYYF